MDTSSSDDSSIEDILENVAAICDPTMDTSSSEDSDTDSILEYVFGFANRIIADDTSESDSDENGVEHSDPSFCELSQPDENRVANGVRHVFENAQLARFNNETREIELTSPFPVAVENGSQYRQQILASGQKIEESLNNYFSKLAIVDQICVEQFEEEQTASFPLRALKRTCMCDFPGDSECSICKKKLSDLASLCDSALDVMDQIYDCLVEGITSTMIPISLICLAGEKLERIIKSNENFESRSVPNSSLYRMIYRDELADNNPNSTVTEYIFQRICNRHSQFQIANIAEELSIIGKTHENATEKSSRKDITQNNKKKKGLVKQSNRSPAGGSVRSRITKETSKNNTLKDSPASRTRSKKCKTPNCIDSPASRTRSKKSKKISSNEKGKDSKITVIKRKRKSLDGSQFIY